MKLVKEAIPLMVSEFNLNETTRRKHEIMVKSAKEIDISKYIHVARDNEYY
jgi:hypothetical protein